MTWTAFAALTSATGQELDDNYAAAFAGGRFLGALSGTNAISFAVTANAPPISALVDGMTFYGVAAGSNSASTSLAIGSFSPLVVYKDSPAGTVLLAGGEIITGAACWFTYDSTLNTGSGGFHLSTGGAILSGQSINMGTLKIGTGAVLKRMFSQQSTVTFSVVAANGTQDQNVAVSGVLIGDNAMIAPPTVVIAGAMYSAYVPANGTVAIRAANVTGATLTPTGGTFRITTLGFV